MGIEKIKAAIRDIPDFPKPGIIFKDITPILHEKELFAETIEIMAEKYKKNPPDYVAGIESRGFIFGAPLAIRLGCGFVPIRKKGKLPYKTVEASYKLEYGEAEIEIHEDAIAPGDRVLLADDLMATGGTMAASAGLIQRLGAEIIGIEFLIELAFLKGRDKLSGYPVFSMIVEN